LHIESAWPCDGDVSEAYITAQGRPMLLVAEASANRKLSGKGVVGSHSVVLGESSAIRNDLFADN
jgi:hypothetical protein